MTGRTLSGRYHLLRQLGEGGMGAVHEARHTGTGRRVAVKQMTGHLVKDKTLRARFEVEARAAGQLETQHVVQVLDVGEDENGAPFIVMEYLQGEDLSRLVKRLGPLPAELALRLAVQACLGLEKAHAAGIIHRDIKPANMFLAERDSGEVVLKLLDFGIAKVVAPDSPSSGSTLTRSGSLLGSPQYMSPEQARGTKKLDHRTDLWSLGVVLYMMLAGRTPYHDIDAMGQLIITLCSGPPPPVQTVAPWVRPEVAVIVENALGFGPHERYQSAAEMAAAMKALLPGGWSLARSMLIPLSAEARSVVASKTPRALAAEHEAASRAGRGDAEGDVDLASATTRPEKHGDVAAPAASGRDLATRPESITRTGASPGRRALWPLFIAASAAGAVAAFVVLKDGKPAAEPPAVSPVSAASLPAPSSAVTATAAATPEPVISPAVPTAVPSATATATASASSPASSSTSPRGRTAPPATAKAAATATATAPPGKGTDVWGRE